MGLLDKARKFRKQKRKENEMYRKEFDKVYSQERMASVKIRAKKDAVEAARSSMGALPKIPGLSSLKNLDSTLQKNFKKKKWLDRFNE